MIIDWKWLQMPWSNKTKEVQVVAMWEVRWESRHGAYSSDVRPQLECFQTREQAVEFSVALENAFKLIRHTSGTTIHLKQSK